LTRNLLNFARGDSLVPTVLDVRTAVDQADEMIGHVVGYQVSRVKDVQDGVWPVLTDGHQLEIALLNLAINARDAMPDGGTLNLMARNLDPAARPEMLPVRDYVSILVRDSGHGMPPDVLTRATEPFFTTKPEGKGTGLGLPMVHAFALRSGGCLRIDSRDGEGTTVEIILPRASVSNMNNDTEDSQALPEPTRPATILVVEDDDQVRQITVGYLRDRGYTVVDARNAETAVVLSHSMENLDLLLTDVAMPGAAGPELARRLRLEKPDLPVLFITGDGGRGDLAGEFVLRKPFSGADLVRAISRRLDRRGRTRHGA
jgi:CheY-like chemotaxis protein